VLASFTITLKQTSEAEWTAPEATGVFVRALFYELLRSKAPGLAEEIHGSSSDAPFTVSPMIRLRRSAEGEPPAYRVRFTTLTEPVFDAACQAIYLLHTTGTPVRISKAEFEVQDLDFRRQKRMCRLARYQDLARGECERIIPFRFLTPTAFKNGKANVPLPIPRLMFGGYLRKWNTFAPEDLRIDESLLTEIEDSVLISRHDIRSRTLDLGAMKMVGFTGECTLAASNGIRPESLRALNTLARFACFSGTGAKTTIGMGQTAVESEE